MTKSRTVAVLIVLAIIAIVSMKPAFSWASPTEAHGLTHFGNYTLQDGQTINGDLTVIGGDADIEGTVTGNVYDPTGTVTIGDDGSVGGNVSDSHNWSDWLPFAPSATVAHEKAKLMTRLGYSVLVVLAFLIFPIRARKALDRVEHHPGLSAAAGVVTFVAMFPLALILFLTVVGWPLIPFEFIAIFALTLIGQAALGLVVGRRIHELVHPQSTPSPLWALVIGLVILSAAEILPVVGWLVTGLVCVVGLGAAILSFIRETSFGPPQFTPGGQGPQGPRPTISGPPMAAG